MKKRYNVTKWRDNDLYLCFFLMLLCGFSTSTGGTDFINSFFYLNAMVAMILFWLLLPLRRLYRTDIKLPKPIRITAIILRIYGLIVFFCSIIKFIIYLNEYADNVKNH